MNNDVIKIKCRLVDSLSGYQYKIRIYDDACNLIIDDFTDAFGNYDFCFSKYGIYRIVITNCVVAPYEKKLLFYVNKCCCKELVVMFNESNKHIENPITFNVTDRYYKGLPIMKGKVILWTINK